MLTFENIGDTTGVKKIRVSTCPITGINLLSMEIPVYESFSDTTDFHLDWITLFAEDFGKLLCEGLTPHWRKLAGGPVAVPDPHSGDYLRVADLILEDNTAEYLDCDPLNLRRDNLKPGPELVPSPQGRILKARM
jgi:hypothetical protein